MMKMWQPFTCYNGLALVRVESIASRSVENRKPTDPCNVYVENSPKDGLVLLPFSNRHDVIVEHIPLALELNDNEVKSLITAEKYNAYSASRYGVENEQDKYSNEDFSLSAAFSDNDNNMYSCIVLADGVSSKTFWSARASRISCLITYKVLYKEIKNSGSNVISKQNNIFKVRALIKKEILICLKKDKEYIIEEGITSNKSTSDFFYKYIDRDDFWYNTTLLFACIGRENGIAGWVGDGGVAIYKELKNGKSQEAYLMRSDDDVTIDNFVSLPMNSMKINLATLNKTIKESKTFNLYLSSDGVDRTLSLNDISYSSLKINSNKSADESIKEMEGERFKGNREIDNYSIAMISFPIISDIKKKIYQYRQKKNMFRPKYNMIKIRRKMFHTKP